MSKIVNNICWFLMRNLKVATLIFIIDVKSHLPTFQNYTLHVYWFLRFFPVLVMYNFFSPKNPTLHVYSNLHIYQRDESNLWINTNHHISKISLIWIKVSSLFSFSFRKRPVQKRYESSKTVAEAVYDNNGCKNSSLGMKKLLVFCKKSDQIQKKKKYVLS